MDDVELFVLPKWSFFCRACNRRKRHLDGYLCAYCLRDGRREVHTAIAAAKAGLTVPVETSTAHQPSANRRQETWRARRGNVELVKCRAMRSAGERLAEWFELYVGDNTTRLTIEELERVHLVTFRYVSEATDVEPSDDFAAS